MKYLLIALLLLGSVSALAQETHDTICDTQFPNGEPVASGYLTLTFKGQTLEPCLTSLYKLEAGGDADEILELIRRDWLTVKARLQPLTDSGDYPIGLIEAKFELNPEFDHALLFSGPTREALLFNHAEIDPDTAEGRFYLALYLLN